MLLTSLVQPLKVVGPGSSGGPAPIPQGQAFADLPAWRWLNFDFHTSPGDLPSTAGMLTERAIGAVLFDFARFLWLVLFGVVRLAYSNAIMGALTKSGAAPFGLIERAFNDIAGKHAGEVVILLSFLIGVTVAVMRYARNQTDGIRTFVRSFVPMVLLLSILSANAVDHGAGTTPMSSGWIVNQTMSIGDQLGGLAPSLVASATAASYPAPSCAAYEAALEQEAGQAGSSMLIPITMSDLYTSTFVNSWSDAQFGSEKNIGARIGCRAAEQNNNIPAGGKDTAGAACDTSSPGCTQVATEEYADSTILGLSGMGKPAWTNFTDMGEADAFSTQMVFWASCEYVNGAWKVVPAFKAVTGGPVSPNAPATATFCKDAWSKGVVAPYHGGSFPGNKNSGPFEWDTSSQTLGAISASTSNAPIAQEFAMNWIGQDAGTAIGLGVISIGTALAYSFPVVLLSIGLFLAQLLFLLAMMLLPFLLLVTLFPTRRDHAEGWLFFGRTAVGAAASQIVFSVLIGALTLMTVLISKAFNSALGGGVPALAGAMFAPIVAMLALHYLMRKVGLAGLTHPLRLIATTGAITGNLAFQKDVENPVNRFFGRAKENLRSESRLASAQAAGAGAITQALKSATKGGAPRVTGTGDLLRTARKEYGMSADQVAGVAGSVLGARGVDEHGRLRTRLTPGEAQKVMDAVAAGGAKLGRRDPKGKVPVVKSAGELLSKAKSAFGLSNADVAAMAGQVLGERALDKKGRLRSDLSQFDAQKVMDTISAQRGTTSRGKSAAKKLVPFAAVALAGYKLSRSKASARTAGNAAQMTAATGNALVPYGSGAASGTRSQGPPGQAGGTGWVSSGLRGAARGAAAGAAKGAAAGAGVPGAVGGAAWGAATGFAASAAGGLAAKARGRARRGGAGESKGSAAFNAVWQRTARARQSEHARRVANFALAHVAHRATSAASARGGVLGWAAQGAAASTKNWRSRSKSEIGDSLKDAVKRMRAGWSTAATDAGAHNPSPGSAGHKPPPPRAHGPAGRSAAASVEDDIEDAEWWPAGGGPPE